MAVQPLNKNDFYFDANLNAVLCADGTVNSYNCHEMTMVWPTYTSFDVPDGSVQKLIPCKFDIWTNDMEYFDTASNSTIKVNLKTGTKTTVTTAASAPPTPPSSWGTPKSNSQQNMGWSYSEPVKENSKPKDPFKKGAVLFHKSTRAKWVYDKAESSGYTLRSFYDKSQTMHIFDRELKEFEEVFF